MAAYGFHFGSGVPDFIRALDAMHQDGLIAGQKITDLEAKFGSKHDDKKKDWTELKSFQFLGGFDGNDKDFWDWELKLQRFVRPFPMMEEWLESVKEQRPGDDCSGGAEESRPGEAPAPGR